jgi:hypothetical protein
MPYRLCQHIKVNGLQCRCPALTNRNYCYFHAELRDRARRRRKTAKAETSFPALEDANSIQVALMQVLDDVAHDRLDSKRASLMLYGLQTASMNLRRTDFEPYALRHPEVDLSAVTEDQPGGNP